MKKILMLLSACTMSFGVSTSIFGNAFVSCRSAKKKKLPSISEEDPGNFEYGSFQEINKFSKHDFNNYVESSLMPIVSLLSNRFLDQDVDQENFDFITVLDSLQSKVNSSNALIWNKKSVNVKQYCIDVFLDDWTFSDLNHEDIELIKTNFISRKNESQKQKNQDLLSNLKDIKMKKKLIEDKVKNVESYINFFNSDNFKKNIDIDSQIINFLKKTSIKKSSPIFMKIIPRFEQIFKNFINGTNFDDIKDLTNVNGQNLISYIKKSENIKKMNENFNSKTSDDKALMLFAIKLNYMYKYISSPDADPENGQFLLEALFKDILACDNFDYKIITDFESSNILKKIKENGNRIYENFVSYVNDIFKNSNSEKSVEPFYCLVEGIMHITKQKVFKTKIDKPVENKEINLDLIFQCICEFVKVIKGNKNNDELEYFNIEDGKEFVKDILLESSLLEGFFIENESIDKTKVAGSTVGVGIAAYWLLGAGAFSLPAGLLGGLAYWWYNKTTITSNIPLDINDNAKDYYNKSWWIKIFSACTDKVNIAKLIDSVDVETAMQNLLNEYQKNQDFQEYIQTFDKLADIIKDDNNSFLKELQAFINQGGFKNIISDLINLINTIESTGNNLTDEGKKQEILDGANNLFKSIIGIDRHKKGEDILVTGSVLKNLINWINNPQNSITKTFDNVFNLFEEKCKQWNDDNFEKHVDNLAKVIKDKKDIEIEYISFEEVKENGCLNKIIKLNYKLKILSTNEVYNIEFKNKNFKKFPKSFKISKFQKE